MAEGEGLDFLTHKVGPLPVWVWGAGIAGGYWVLKNKLGYFGGSSSATGTGSRTTTINETSQLDSQPRFGASGYSSDSQWEGAAINYLVGEEVPPDQASTAVWNYLHSKVLTTQEQKDVNLAIEGIGPPPGIPAPAKVTKPRKPPVKHHRDKKPKHHHKEGSVPGGPGVPFPQ